MNSTLKNTCIALIWSALGTAFGQTPTVLSTVKANIDYGSTQPRIFEDSQNLKYEGRPDRWRFAIEPVLAAKAKDGKLDATWTEIKREKKAYIFNNQAAYKTTVVNRVRIPVWLLPPSVDVKALLKLRRTYKAEGLCDTSINLLPVTKIVIAKDELATLAPGTTLAWKELSFAAPRRFFDLQFDVTESPIIQAKQETFPVLEHLLEIAPTLNFKLTITYDANEAVLSVTSLKGKSIKNTELFAQLGGEGGEHYVSRDDLRKLASTAATYISAEVIGTEEQIKYGQTLFDDFIKASRTVTADEQTFDAKKWEHTYHGDDLRPDKLTKTINKLFTQDQSKQWVKKSGGVESEGHANFFDILGGGATNKSSWSTDELQEALKKREIYAEVEGEMWVVKSIKLVQLNTSAFEKYSNAYFESKQIGKETRMEDRPADLSLSVAGLPDESVVDPVPACATGTVATVLDSRHESAAAGLDLFAKLQPLKGIPNDFIEVQSGRDRAQRTATGTHQCQSKTSLGHSCKVTGNFTDCDEAAKKLKMQDCCPKTKEGGSSIGFTLDKCSVL